MKFNPFQKVIINATVDKEYRKRLLADIRQVLKEEGLLVPPDVSVVIHESKEDTIMVVLPAPRKTALTEVHLPKSGRVDDVPWGLTLEWRESDLVAVGRIDSVTAGALKRELLKAFDDVDLDLSAVKHLSSAGVSALLAGLKHLADHNCRLRLLDVPEVIRNVLEISGISEMIEIIDSLSYPYPMMMSGL